MAGLVDRLVDLLPIVKEHYYHPDMQGIGSIVKALEAEKPLPETVALKTTDTVKNPFA